LKGVSGNDQDELKNHRYSDIFHVYLACILLNWSITGFEI